MSNGLNLLKSYFKRKIVDERSFQEKYSAEIQKVYNLFNQTVEYGESNSALLIGPTDISKTKIVNDVIAQLRLKKSFNRSALIVRLHGLVHTDDRLALKTITTQMHLDNAVDGKVFGSFADNLAFLLACLRSGDRKKSKSVLFIIDEFDLFCSHHNQTLLYNLFDVSQSAQAPICVFGITSRLDVIELLEKRVKSRFSHRQFFVYPNADLNDRIERVRNTFLIPNNSITLPDNYVAAWNKNVNEIVNQKKFSQMIQRALDLNLSDDKFRNILFVLVSQLSEHNPSLSLRSFESIFKEIDIDENINRIYDLSVLELCLLIAMKHHAEIYDNQPMNFEMVYTRYTKFAATSANIKNISRPVIVKAFEHIEQCRLISYVSVYGLGRIQKEYHMFNLEVTPQQIVEAVRQSQNLPTHVVQWATSSLT